MRVPLLFCSMTRTAPGPGTQYGQVPAHRTLFLSLSVSRVCSLSGRDTFWSTTKGKAVALLVCGSTSNCGASLPKRHFPRTILDPTIQLITNSRSDADADTLTLSTVLLRKYFPKIHILRPTHSVPFPSSTALNRSCASEHTKWRTSLPIPPSTGNATSSIGNDASAPSYRHHT